MENGSIRARVETELQRQNDILTQRCSLFCCSPFELCHSYVDGADVGADLKLGIIPRGREKCNYDASEDTR